RGYNVKPTCSRTVNLGPIVFQRCLSPLHCVINTTGTPYYQRQPLRDVVIWYGLSQGIDDGILKEVSGSIQAYTFDDSNTDQFVATVIDDFFQEYGDTTLPDGSAAKLALYFPQTDDLETLRPVIEAKLTELGHAPTLCLRNTSESTQAEVDAFNRLNDPNAPHRVMLLVNKGTEGWNCPSLFACALARRLRTSNNFVLQAASRCLRQVPGNTKKARIYLSADNRSALDRQLQETYGETIAQLDQTHSRSRSKTIRLRKLDLPPLTIRQVVKTVVRKETQPKPLTLRKPADRAFDHLQRQVLTVASQPGTYVVLKQLSDTVEIEIAPRSVDLYTAAAELSDCYRLDFWTVYDQLRAAYDGAAEMPEAHLPALARQIEEQTCAYEVQEETVEKALALVKLDGFKRTESEGIECYTADITYPVEREKLLTSFHEWQGASGDFGFHYDPYNFDSGPEQDFFRQLLDLLGQSPDEVEDVYFTGALTDPNKTDFFVEYRGEDDRMHRYTPDFVLRRKDGKCLIVEIKAEHDKAHPVDGETGRKAMALRQWEDLNPDRLKYHMIFAQRDTIGHEQLKPEREFVEEGKP
ncbi:MAG: restriction endonuclease subunit R, partial [Armatimonadetes bacterium CG_4_10_14_3_um_filter_66_18]